MRLCLISFKKAQGIQLSAHIRLEGAGDHYISCLHRYLYVYIVTFPGPQRLAGISRMRADAGS